MCVYDKITTKGLYDFNEDCEAAAKQCPQFNSGIFKVEDILLGDLTKETVVSFWSSCSVLWVAGYNEYLSKESKRIIKSYRLKLAIQELEEED